MDFLKFFELDKSVPVPLYFQIKKQILDMIESRTLEVGDMLPTETEFCDYLNISRTTIRQAMSELVMEGMLTRQKGVGTFVSQPKIEGQFLQKLESFNEEMKSKNMVPSTKVIGLRKISGIAVVNQKLNIPPEDSLIFLSRLRFADNIPVVFLESYLPYNKYPLMMEQDYERYSLYERYMTLYNARVFRVVRELESVNANRREAKLLEIELRTALSLVKTVGYIMEDAREVPIEYSVASYRGDRNKFRIELYR